MFSAKLESLILPVLKFNYGNVQMIESDSWVVAFFMTRAVKLGKIL
jgi:hypothetical protein